MIIFIAGGIWTIVLQLVILNVIIAKLLDTRPAPDSAATKENER